MKDATHSRRSPVQIAMDELLLERIRLISLVVGIIFIGYAVFDLILLSRPQSYMGAGIAAGVALCFLMVYFLAARNRIRPRYADATSAFLSFAALASAFPLITILHDGHLSVNLLLVLFSASILIGSRFWFAAVAATIATGWAIFLYGEPGSVSAHYSAALYVGVVLSVIMNEFHRRGMYGLVTSRMEAQQQASALEEASRQAQAANALMQAVFQGANDPIYVKDADGRYLMVNPAYLRDFGRPAEHLLGHTATELFGDEEGTKIAEVEQSVRLSGENVVIEETVSSLDQTYLSNIFPYVDGSDKASGIIGISRNITLLKQHEQELARLVSQLAAAKAEAEQATHAKSDFLATMSHEIRTPMNGVLGMAQLLLDTPLTAEQQEYAETISESAETLLGIINDILDLSKIEAGKMTVENVPFRLADRLQSAVQVVELRAKSKGLDLRTEMAPDLPAVVVGDPTRLGQILLNFLSNAVKFTKAGRITMRATAVLESAAAPRLRIEVLDTGIGIETDKLESVFEKFTQAEASTSRHFGGTGLGLPICRKLATLMGGEIGVSSTPGRGSTFWVELPADVAAKDEKLTEPVAEPEPVKPPLADIEGIRVLLVEDNVINQKVALSMLDRMGCHTQHAEDGTNGIGMALDNYYDLILMDVEMPGINGLEATRQILQKMGPAAPPIIALTAHTAGGYREQCLAAGMKECLTKPLDAHQLKETVAGLARKNPRTTGARPTGENGVDMSTTSLNS